MAKYRGIKGKAVLGGVVVGTPLVQGAVAQSATSATIDGAGFNGVVRPGDTFTVAGDAQVYTVQTGGVVGDPTPNQVAVTFTPGVVPGGGWADNSAVTFASNSVAQVKDWQATVSRPVLEVTTMGDEARSITLDTPDWKGRIMALLDYGDAKQQAFIDAVNTNDDPTALAVALVAADGKLFWGDLLPLNARIRAQRGALFEVEFDFQGEGALTPNWN